MAKDIKVFIDSIREAVTTGKSFEADLPTLMEEPNLPALMEAAILPTLMEIELSELGRLKDIRFNLSREPSISNESWNILHLAAWMGNAPMVSFSLEKLNIEVNLLNAVKRTPLQLAMSSRHREVTKILLDHNAYEHHMHDKDPLIHRAILIGDAEIVRHILDAHAGAVHQYDRDTNTPIECAVKGRHTAIVEVLIAAKVNVSQPNYRGNSPLTFAAESGCTEIVRILLDHKADVNKPDHGGNSPLTLAAGEGLIKIMKLLLAHEVDVNQINKEGNSPLMLAAQYRSNHINDYQQNRYYNLVMKAPLISLKHKIVDDFVAFKINGDWADTGSEAFTFILGCKDIDVNYQRQDGKNTLSLLIVHNIDYKIMTMKGMKLLMSCSKVSLKITTNN